MPRRTGHVTAYRLHRASGQARVIVNREHIYLGKFGAPESREEYARVLAELNAGGGSSASLPSAAATKAPISVNETILAYWRFAKSHYVKNQTPTRELEGIQLALRPLRELYGTSLAAEFGPKKLKVVRRRWSNAACLVG